jgi:D-alanyl-D-alanine carboxypeptidase
LPSASASPSAPTLPLVSPEPEPELTKVLARELQVRLDGIREKYGLPGVSATILFPDGTTWVGTSGYGDVADEVEMTQDTAFSVASVTKTFTSALILALVEEGRIELDSPADVYLPELDLDRGITIRRLLDHTSGLHDYFLNPKIDRVLLRRTSKRWTEAQALRYVRKPYFKPGRGYHYSNTNYLILGILAERVGRAPLGTQLRERFFEPYGLEHTTYQPDEAPEGPVAHGYRLAGSGRHVEAEDLSDRSAIVPFTSVVTAAGGAGGIASTSSDLVRWARALYSGRVLGPEMTGVMINDVYRTERYRPPVPYGLGVQMVELAGERTLGHSGRMLGFRSVLRWLPDREMAVAVLTNQSVTDPGIIARALLRIALRPAGPCDPGRGIC